MQATRSSLMLTPPAFLHLQPSPPSFSHALNNHASPFHSLPRTSTHQHSTRTPAEQLRDTPEGAAPEKDKKKRSIPMGTSPQAGNDTMVVHQTSGGSKDTDRRLTKKKNASPSSALGEVSAMARGMSAAMVGVEGREGGGSGWEREGRWASRQRQVASAAEDAAALSGRGTLWMHRERNRLSVR